MSTSWDNVNTGQNLPVIKEVHGSPYKLSENLRMSFICTSWGLLEWLWSLEVS
jgi:hypothetical protein